MADSNPKRRVVGNFLALVVLFVAGRLPDSVLADALGYAAFGYIAVDIGLRARAGYFRRRPHWTPDSWRRYLIARCRSAPS